MSCDICGKPTVDRYCQTTGAPVSACSAICAGMLSVFAVPKEPWLHQLEVWEARRRRAEVNGLPFDERPPLSPTDALMRSIAIRIAARQVTP